MVLVTLCNFDCQQPVRSLCVEFDFKEGFRNRGDEELTRTVNYVVRRKQDRSIADDGTGAKLLHLGVWRLAAQNGNDYFSRLEFDAGHISDDSRKSGGVEGAETRQVLAVPLAGLAGQDFGDRCPHMA